jgi:predicted MFS family arabinose efflux permease
MRGRLDAVKPPSRVPAVGCLHAEMSAVLQRQRFHYAWIVAGVTFVVLMMAAGFRSVPGVLFVPLGHEFGWSHALIGGAVSVNLIVYGLGAPFAAALVERFGVRRVVTVALIQVAVAAGLSTQMTKPWELYLLWGVVIGSATGALAVPLAAIISTRWFSTRRGLVSGLLTASNASGQLVFLPLLAWISVTYGWRWTAGAVVIAATGLVIPLAIIFLRHSPAEIGVSPYGSSEPEAPSAPLVNPFRNAISTLREFAGRRDFQLLVFAFFVCGATTNGLIGTHLIAACADHGFTQVQGASLLAAIGVFDIIGTITSGWLTDRYDPRWLLFWYYALRGISLLGLNAALNSAGLGLAAFVIFDGLDWVATVPPTIALCRKMAGPERVGIVFAWVFCSHQLGAAFAAWGAGFTRTWLGTYQPAFLISGGLAIAAAMVSLMIGRRVVRLRFA